MLLFSCKKENQQNTTIYKNLSEFSKIELNGVFDVYLKQDSVYSIEIVGNENWVGNIVFKVENEILKIDNQAKGKWLKPKEDKVKIYISSNRPKMIFANETCNIETLNPIISDEFGIVMSSKLNQANLELNCNTFYFWNNFPCGGKLTLRGNAEILKIWNFAIMSVDAKNLTTEYALIENSSKGNCEVFVTNKMEYSIHGIGDIHLYGNPKELILNEISSTGKLLNY